MTQDTTATVVQTAPDTQQDTLALLLQDREWVETEFAAIMTASGFGDRVIVGTLPGPPHGHRRQVREGDPRWRPACPLPVVGAESRVRSPPGRS